MWKYLHSVKDNPKSGYNCPATGQWQTAFCVCQREHWDLVFSQEDNPKTHRSIREISCKTGIHWLTVHRIHVIYRDFQSTVSNDIAHRSCLKPIALPVWLAASSCC